VHSGWVIESVAKDTGFGIRVSIYWESGGFGYVATYGHLKKSAYPEIPFNLKNRNYRIAQGEAIGWVDSTGFSTGHHLHLGLYQYKNFVKLNTNNGYQGAIDPWQFVKENYMEFFQVEGEATIVVKNLDGKYYPLATDTELYPYVAKIFGLEGKSLDSVPKDEVQANLGGQAQAGITFVKN
jgi:murein DD-endopeptidase MepM/ murein hydrolase activator NlpD